METMPEEGRLRRLQGFWAAFESWTPRAASVLQALAVAAQFALVIVIVRKFQIESESFQLLSALALGGFLVHTQLPRALRLPFFCALSLAGIVVVLGVANALWLVGTGLVLIGLCHLPLAFGLRVAALVAVGVLLALMRADRLPSPMSSAIWPILGSIFMFRLILYVYDLKHRKDPPSVGWTLAYFFMLPNVCFPLFPVVDYARFRSTYYSDAEYRIYQRGVHWMFRGVCHLLIYRLVYQHMVLAPVDVTTTADLVQYALGAFFLYLRVSGYFHLIVGMLLLFGFNLPETHHLYFFSSSFSDFWRRINIYWKDFMMKLFYYPAYFQLRRFGPTNALILSTAVVFLMTWVLHAYQWFWLRGSMLLEAHDILFWSILGAAMIANSLYEQRHGRRRALAGHRPPPLVRVAVALRTLATFTVLCALWSLWSSDSLKQWIELWTVTNSTWLAAVLAVAVLALALASAALDRLSDRRQAARPREPARAKAAPYFFWAEAVPTGLVLLALALVGFPEVSSRLGTTVAAVSESARSERLNERDTVLLERGYYEHLIAVNEQNAELWELYNGKPRDSGPLTLTAAWRKRDDFLLGEFVPGAQLTFLGQPFHINRWGIRDRDYEMAKPAGTFRIVILGSSHVYGRGVGNSDVFENVLEQRLNAELDGGVAYEILNFAVPSRNPINAVQFLRETVAPFEPDVVIQFAHTRDLNHARNYLVSVIQGVDPETIPYPYLRDLLQQVIGGSEIPPQTILERRLTPHMNELLAWGYREIAAECRRQGAIPVFVLLPLTVERSSDLRAAERKEAWIAKARTAGLESIDVSDVYDGHEDAELAVATWDDHANPLGHRLIADRLFAELVARPELLGRPTQASRAQAAVRGD
jgi:D-alanyl-lipoteichoic acid acyltransferase DltB (MBOAT superfamily)